MRALGTVLGILLLVTACGDASLPAPQETAAEPAASEVNDITDDIRVVMEFYRPGITPDERFALIHPEYIQHNAGYVQYAEERNITANEAFRQIRIAQAQARAAGRGGGPAPAPAGAPEGNTFHILYADGPTVVRIAQRFNADPQRPGEFYEIFWWDTFTVRDGQLYEHWDAALAGEVTPAAPDPDAPPLVQTPVPAPPGWPPMAAVPTPGCASDPAVVTANKEVARAFFAVGAGDERLGLLDESYVEHNPVVRRYAENEGLTHLEALRAFGGVRPLDLTVPGGAEGAPAAEMARVAFGACDIVTAIHAHYGPHPVREGEFYERYTFDTFRIRDGRIIEHWDGGSLTEMPVMPAAD